MPGIWAVSPPMSAQPASAHAFTSPLMSWPNTRGLEFAHADVIEEEQGFGAEHGDVVDAMVHEVLADRVVLVEGDGDLQFRADAVHAADEHGAPVLRRVEGEQPAESADGAEHFRATGLADLLFQAGLERVGEMDVHARAGVRGLG